MREIVEPGKYIALPDESVDQPWVLACHGSGREAHSYREVPFYRQQRDIALEAGCAFAACDMGPDTYGTPRGLEVLEAFYEECIARFPLRKTLALWGSSAGGCSMFRFAMAHPERVELLMGTFPVIDLSGELHLKSMRNAWGGGDDAALLDAIEPYNPMTHLELLPDVPIVIAHGTSDVAVPIEKNALALQKALGERVRLFITNDEHSTSAFGLYETPLYGQAIAQMVNAEK